MNKLFRLNLTANFEKDFFWKNCSLKFLAGKFDQRLVGEIEELTSLLPKKEYITVDIGFLNLEYGKKTCRDTGWHVDGVGNDYLLYCKGDFRTNFLNKDVPVIFPDKPELLRSFNDYLHQMLMNESGTEIPDSTLIKYSSQDVHQGRVATGPGKRFFLRVCSSNYLNPKNFRLI